MVSTLKAFPCLLVKPSSNRILRNAADAKLLVGIQVKDTPDCLCLRFVDCQHAAAFVVAPEPVVSQHMTVFDCLPEAEFQTL